jgi:O-antigen/teichoic acid export membrane protein
MGKFKNKLLDLSSVGIADIFASAISAFFWFYIASLMSPEKYGELTYFLSIAGVASAISMLGAHNTLIVYSAKNVKIQPAMYVLTLMVGSVSSLIIFVIFFSIGTSFLILGYIIFGLVTSELIGRKLFRSYSIYVIIQRVLSVSLAVGLYYILGNEGILIGMAISFAPYIIWIIKGFQKSKINFELVKDKFPFIINNYFLSLTSALHGSLDKLLIAPLFGFAILGNYSLGIQFNYLLYIIPMIVGKYIIPYDSTGVENKKLKKIIILISVVLAILGSTIGPVVISFFFPSFIEAEDVIRIVSWAIIPGTISLVYQSKFLGAEQSRRVLYMSIYGTVTQIIGIVVLGTLYDVNGIAVALVLGYSAVAGYAIISEKVNPVRFKM